MYITYIYIHIYYVYVYYMYIYIYILYLYVMYNIYMYITFFQFLAPCVSTASFKALSSSGVHFTPVAAFFTCLLASVEVLLFDEGDNSIAPKDSPSFISAELNSPMSKSTFKSPNSGSCKF